MLLYADGCQGACQAVVEIILSWLTSSRFDFHREPVTEDALLRNHARRKKWQVFFYHNGQSAHDGRRVVEFAVVMIFRSTYLL